MSATSRPEILDPALLRPGRLDRQVLVDRPDLDGRRAILEIHSKNVVLGPDVNLGKIAGRYAGLGLRGPGQHHQRGRIAGCQKPVLLGGWVTEKLVFQEISTRAQNDLRRASDIARAMVTAYGHERTTGTGEL